MAQAIEEKTEADAAHSTGEVIRGVLEWIVNPAHWSELIKLLSLVTHLPPRPTDSDMTKLNIKRLEQEVKRILNHMTRNPEGGFPNREDNGVFHFFHYQDLNTKENRVTRIGATEDVADDWTDVSAIVTWNLWGMAPVNAVVDLIRESKENNEDVSQIMDKLTHLLTEGNFMSMFREKPFRQREFEDENLKRMVPGMGDAPASTFFAITGHQEAWLFADAFLFLTRTRDGLNDHQDRLRRAAYLSDVDSGAYAIDVSKLFAGWKWYIGTNNAFREPESTSPPFGDCVHVFTGRFSGTGTGLFMMSTHEPHAIGYQEFKFKPERTDDSLALKGFLWGFWKNNFNKGVVAVVTHFLTSDVDKPKNVLELEEILVDRAQFFSSQVDELDVYALGDLNWEAGQILEHSNGVLHSMTQLTGNEKTTKDGDHPGEGEHRLDHIFGGKFDKETGTMHKLDANMKSFVVPKDGTWAPMSFGKVPQYIQGLSDHKMVLVVKESLYP